MSDHIERMARYSTETADMFDGQTLDRPRILPKAGETLDAFDSQPRPPTDDADSHHVSHETPDEDGAGPSLP